MKPPGALFLVLLLSLQTKPADTRPEFEVASVKPSTSTAPGLDQLTPGRLHAKNLTLQQLILVANKFRDFQVSGGPGWITSDKFDIEAKSDTATDPDATLLMLQRLLEERFQLSFHRESREEPAYILTVAKTGPKMKASTCTAATARLDRPDPCGLIGRSIEGTNQVLSMKGVGVSTSGGLAYQSLAWQLSISLDRAVIDQTGLTGKYDLTLKWAKDQTDSSLPIAGAAGPSIFTAVQEQLGLKLDSGRGAADVIVIDRADKPTPR